jgi:SAM-dependent methyltransferase
MDAIVPTGPYGEYAAVYDQTGQMRFSIMMALYLQEIVGQHPTSGHRMLDLACGTGTLALLLAEHGWQVAGIDLSEAMLEQAQCKAALAGVAVSFQRGDMRDFVVPEPVDLVTCCYDSLNYLLTEDDLLAAFRAIHSALRTGGLCCFDLASEHFLREYWRDVEEYASDAYRHTMASSFDDKTGYSTLHLTGTRLDEDGSVRVFRETHVERAFAPSCVTQLLEQAGLRVEALYDCFTFQPVSPTSLRHFWVARR